MSVPSTEELAKLVSAALARRLYLEQVANALGLSPLDGHSDVRIRDDVLLAIKGLQHTIAEQAERLKFETWFLGNYRDANIGVVETTVEHNAAWAAWQAAKRDH